MLITLHRNAATTPRQRAYIRASDKSVATLAHELGVSETTIRRWRGRSDPADRSSRPHRLATSLSNEEAEIAVALRTRLALSLDDALEVLRRCLRPDISRSALHRLWRRRGVARPAGEGNWPTGTGIRHEGFEAVGAVPASCACAPCRRRRRHHWPACRKNGRIILIENSQHKIETPRKFV